LLRRLRGSPQAPPRAGPQENVFLEAEEEGSVTASESDVDLISSPPPPPPGIWVAVPDRYKLILTTSLAFVICNMDKVCFCCFFFCFIRKARCLKFAAFEWNQSFIMFTRKDGFMIDVASCSGASSCPGNAALEMLGFCEMDMIVPSSIPSLMKKTEKNIS
jgi:hypothetical protein